MAQRPGTKGATQLLNSSIVDEWQCMLLNYEDAVARVSVSKKKPELVSLDQWLWNDFPQLVKDRSPPSCTKDELTRIMQWKLLRGKNRPALLGLIGQNTESTVQTISQEAFRILFGSVRNVSWKAALNKLAELRGVGPATASAILAPLASSIPFMADETLEAVTHSTREYTLRAYDDMYCALHKVCQGPLEGKLSPEDAGKALWTAAMISIHPPLSTAAKVKANAKSSTSATIKNAATKDKDSTKVVIVSKNIENSSEKCVVMNEFTQTRTCSSRKLESMKESDINGGGSASQDSLETGSSEENACDGGKGQRRSKRIKI